jgi:hypothetical protein
VSAALDVADRSERASFQPEGSYYFGGVEHSSSFEPSGGGEVARLVLVGFEEVLNSVLRAHGKSIGVAHFSPDE